MVGRHFVYFGFQNCTTTPNRFFGHALFLQVKIRKMAFSAGSLYFMFLKPCSFNINVRKVFHLFWFQNCTARPRLVFWPRPFYADKSQRKAFLHYPLIFCFLKILLVTNKLFLSSWKPPGPPWIFLTSSCLKSRPYILYIEDAVSLAAFINTS